MLVEEDAPAIVIADPANTAKLDALPRLIISGIRISDVSEDPKARKVRPGALAKLMIHKLIYLNFDFVR